MGSSTTTSSRPEPPAFARWPCAGMKSRLETQQMPPAAAPEAAPHSASPRAAQPREADGHFPPPRDGQKTSPLSLPGPSSRPGSAWGRRGLASCSTRLWGGLCRLTVNAQPPPPQDAFRLSWGGEPLSASRRTATSPVLARPLQPLACRPAPTPGFPLHRHPSHFKGEVFLYSPARSVNWPAACKGQGINP